MVFPKHEFECPQCGMPLNENGWHIDGTAAWEKYECEYNATHYSKAPVRVRPTQTMMNDPAFKELVEQEAKADEELTQLRERRDVIRTEIRERLLKG